MSNIVGKTGWAARAMSNIGAQSTKRSRLGVSLVAIEKLLLLGVKSWGKFRNGVVRDESALTREFAAMKEEPGDAFRSAIEAAHLDFETETLVLLRHTEGKLGGGIRFGAPSLFRSKGSDPRSVLTLRVESDERDPQVASQTAVVEHCYAVAVKTAEVDMAILSLNEQVVFATTLGSSSPTY